MTDTSSSSASKAADLFIKTFYKLYDTQRSALPILYKDDASHSSNASAAGGGGNGAAILWNGNAYAGIAKYKEFFMVLATSQHEIQSYDSQPIISDAGTHVLVSVTGLVKFGDAPQRPFHEAFVLMPVVAADTGKKTYLVASDMFRFI